MRKHLRRTACALAIVVALLASPVAKAAPDELPGFSLRGLDAWLASLLEYLVPAPTAVTGAADGPTTADAPTWGSDPPTVHTQDGPTCDPTTTEMGCGMDPNG